MSDEQKEVNEKMTEALTALKSSQDKLTQDVNKKFEDLDGLDKEAITKASKASGEAFEMVQDMKRKTEAQQKEIEAFKAEMYRMPGGAQVDEKSGPEYRDAFLEYAMKGTMIKPELVEESAAVFVEKIYPDFPSRKKEILKKELVAGINPQGGYWIRPERSQEMVRRIFETSPIRSVASVGSTVSDVVEMVIDDNEAASGGFVAELDDRPETGTPDIGLLSIPVHEQFAQPVSTQKMIDDAGFDIERWLQVKIADRLSRDENTAFVTGSGSKSPKGFLTFPAWAQADTYERNAIEQINSQSATTFTYNGLIDLWTSLKEFYQANAVFLTKRRSFADLAKLVDGENRPLLNFNLLKDGTDLTMLGRRIIFADDMPSVTGGALALAYGDFGTGYQIIDRIGFRVIRDEITTKGKVKHYTTKRTAGTVKNFEAIKIQVISV